MMLDRSFVSSTRLQESNFVHNLMNNLVQYVNYTSLDLNLERFSSFHLALMVYFELNELNRVWYSVLVALWFITYDS